MRAKSLLCRKDPGARKLTKDEVNKLKSTSEFMTPDVVPFKYKAMKFLNNLRHFLTFRAGLGTNQCKVYGHVIPPAKQEIVTHSRCRDCGEFVARKSQLRKASLV